MAIERGQPLLASDINNLTFFPIGAILTFSTTAWSATSAKFKTIWKICDGQNGTPNLVNKFLRGATSSGSAYDNPITTTTQSLYIETNNLPDHTHTVVDPGHNHRIDIGPRSGGNESVADGNTRGSYTSIEPTVIKTSYTGIKVNGGGSSNPAPLQVNIMPSYYTVIYIMKVA
jgi:hypothetical protein